MSEAKFVVSAPTAPFGVAAAGNVKSAARRRPRQESLSISFSAAAAGRYVLDRWRTPILPPTRSDAEADGWTAGSVVARPKHDRTKRALCGAALDDYDTVGRAENLSVLMDWPKLG